MGTGVRNQAAFVELMVGESDEAFMATPVMPFETQVVERAAALGKLEYRLELGNVSVPFALRVVDDSFEER